MKTKLLTTMLFLFAGTLIFSMITGFKSLQDKKPWTVPDKYLKMANPNATNAESIKEGKEVGKALPELPW